MIKFISTAYQTRTFIFDLKNCRLRNNNGKWLMVVNLEKSFSMKNCPMVKKILKILYTRLKKVSQCKFNQKETILKLGNTLKSKSKFTKSKIGWGASPSIPYQGFTLKQLMGWWTQCPAADFYSLKKSIRAIFCSVPATNFLS